MTFIIFFLKHITKEVFLVLCVRGAKLAKNYLIEKFFSRKKMKNSDFVQFNKILFCIYDKMD